MPEITYKGLFDIDQDALRIREEINSNSEFNFDQWIIDQLPLKDNIRILDIGCGTGRYLDKIKNSFNSIFIDVVDKNPIDLKFVDNFYLSDFDKFELTNSYDIIMSSYALYYSDNFLNLILKLISKSDFIFICGPGQDTNIELGLEPIKDFLTKYEMDFLNSKFKVEYVRLNNKVIFETREKFEKWWKNHNSYTGKDLNLEFPLKLSKNVLGIKIEK